MTPASVPLTFEGSRRQPAVSPAPRSAPTVIPWRGRAPRIGVIHNARARHNIGRPLPLVTAGCEHVMPATHQELHDVLAEFVASGIEALVIDGGDGTVRDILSVLARYFPEAAMRIALVPTGKTNALALDLGVPSDWTVARAIEAVVAGRTAPRRPIEVRRDGAAYVELAGLIFGTGAFVRSTRLAQRTHRLGAFNGLAVGLSILGGVGQTILGRPNNVWRRGETVRIALDDGEPAEGAQYLMLASTLRRLPLGVKPFGPERDGLKLLRIEAPARRIGRALPAILGGTDRRWLAAMGYHRGDADRIELTLDGDFVLDGEVFEGGRLSLCQGAPVAFVVP